MLIHAVWSYQQLCSFSSSPCQTQQKLNHRNNVYCCCFLLVSKYVGESDWVITHPEELFLLWEVKTNRRIENNGITVHSTMPLLCLESAGYRFTSLSWWRISSHTHQIIDIFTPLSHFTSPLVPFNCQHHLFDWIWIAHRIIIQPMFYYV